MSANKPANESLEEHRKHCKAKFSCPFEEYADRVDGLRFDSHSVKIRNAVESYRKNGLSKEVIIDSFDFSDGVCTGTARPFRLPPDLFYGSQEDSGIPMWLSAAYHLASADDADDNALATRILSDFAKCFGAYSYSLNSDCANKYGEPFASGVEASVYDGGREDVIKVSSLSLGSESALQKVERILLGNHYFPETKYSVIGVGAERKGESDLSFLLKQKKIEFADTVASDERIGRFLKSRGFVLRDDFFWTFESEDGSIACLDMHGSNVVLTRSGEMVVIDSCVIPSTAELKLSVLGLKGNYDYSNPPNRLFCNREH